MSADGTPEQYRRWEAEARQAARKAHSHNARQIQLELADIYKSLAERTEGQRARSSAGQGARPACQLVHDDPNIRGVPD